jgi:hypothetical protein
VLLLPHGSNEGARWLPPRNRVVGTARGPGRRTAAPAPPLPTTRKRHRYIRIVSPSNAEGGGGEKPPTERDRTRPPQVMRRESYSRVKRGHIVPAVYLRNFAESDLVALHRTDQAGCELRNVRTAGTREPFYWRQRPDGTQIDDIEASLSVLEENVSASLTRSWAAHDSRSSARASSRSSSGCRWCEGRRSSRSAPS